MDPATIRHHLHQKPFRPFSVRMTGGERVPVRKRQWAMITPSGDMLIVFTGKKVGSDYEMKLLHVPLVEEVKAELRGNGGRRRSEH